MQTNDDAGTETLSAAKAMHCLLHGMLAAVPLTAVAGAWLTGHDVTVLGFGTIAPPIAQSLDFGRNLSDLHTNLGTLIIWLAGAHAAAALYHHFILRDHVLVSMLPAWLVPEAQPKNLQQ